MTIEYRYMRKAAPGADESGRLEGRAWVYGSSTMIGKAPYGFREIIRAGAGRKSVNDGDIVLLDNHEHRLPLARMSAGTLEMKDGPNGGDWTATPADTSYAKDVVKNVRAGNYGGCSFGFEVIRDKWTDDKGEQSDPMNGTNREILEMKVHEISVCTFPAYDTTKVSARAMVASARGIKNERAAAATYSDLSTCGDCGATGQYGVYCTGCGTPMSQDQPSGDFCSSCGAALEDRTVEHVCEERADDSKKPYGDVTYADPGYQKDGKKRYPLDTKKHAKAAWSYINQAKNAAAYSATQLASIKSKIRAALTKFGVKSADDEKKVAVWAMLCDFREMTEGDDPEGDLNDVSFGVLPGGFIRSDDANALAKAIKDAHDSESRVAAINLAINLGVPDCVPDHWGSAGEIGAVASDETHRDMGAIYELAIELPATRTSLDIVKLAEPYLSTITREKHQEPDPEPDPELTDPMVLRQRFQEARDRLHNIDKGV